ncbi:RNA-binding S4 domain-containing protein [Janthinobacterium fluminis]|uniref:S4 domain-containing protein n=1 Tax=Janthinobacterium fluminis TaxID=2987524 RepID=A0ABT5K5K5_9BURK|nr:S4 domain-containing protein [Janthinobacterium fluminis]MDC8760204.1 S4 domain-containing protein [Janthinobacterium fluminis]
MTETVRIDKWLWAARFFKTRSLAADAVEKGKVRVAGERVKPARPVRLGDELLVDNGADSWELRVRGLSEQRGGASVARLLYGETPASVARRAAAAEQRKLYSEPGAAIKGRPSKRERRQLSRVGGDTQQ